MKKNSLVLLFGLISFALFSQPPGRGRGGEGRMKLAPNKGAIAGKILDESTGLGIGFASIAVFKTGTEEMVAGENSKENGRFFLKDLNYGIYDLKINFLGYKPFLKEKIELNADNRFGRVGQIYLQEDAQQLDEVEVTAKREMVQFGLDKRVFNVDKDLGAVSGDATEILKNLPSVEVDIDGNVSLRGNSNVKIFVNGRPSALTGLGRTAILQQIPANIIKRIEVMTNPSAKYSPEGQTGIINIITKKQNKQGFNLNATASYDSYRSKQAALNLNYRIGKFNLFSNYSYRNGRRLRRGFIDTDNFLPTIDFEEINFDADGFRTSHTFTGGFEYYFNARSVLSLSSTYSPRESYTNGINTYNFFDSEKVLTERSEREDKDTEEEENFDYSATYNKTFNNEDQTLTLMASFAQSEELELEQFEEDFFDANGNLTPQQLRQNTPVFDEDSKWLLQGDYTQKLKSNLKFETGYRVTIADRSSDYERNDFDFSKNEFIKNDTFTNIFKYDEDVYAVYGLVSGNEGKIEYSFGLRAEQAFTASNLEDQRFTIIEKFPIENNYFKLYPTAAIAYPLSENGKVQLNYSRRVNRPRGRQLNPAIDISNPTNWRVGNPFLKPEFINSYEIGYLKSFEKGTFNTNFFFRDVNDAFGRFLDLTSVPNVNISTTDNFESRQDYGVELIGSFRQKKWLSMNGSLSGYWQTVDAGEVLDGATSSGFQWSGRVVSNFTVWKDMSIQWMVFYRSKAATPQGTRYPFVWTDLALRKPILKKRGSITVKLSDPFNSRKFRFDLETPSTLMRRQFQRPGQAVSLAFSYQFGEQDRKKRRRGSRGGFEGGGEEF